MIFVLVLVVVILLSGCGTAHTLATSNESRDSVQVEVHTRTVIIPDSIYIEIPVQTAERTTSDTTSYLINEYAESEARINGDGTLTHTLWTREQRRAVPTRRVVEYRDSIVYRERTVAQTKEVAVRHRPTLWQRIQIRGFWILFITLIYINRMRIAKIITKILL